MSSKATTAQLTEAGWDAKQFGDPADFTAYLQSLLDTVAAMVRDIVGASTYDAAMDGLTFTRLQQLELALSEAALWRRRAAFMDSSVAAYRGSEIEYSRLIARYYANADQADGRAAELYRALGVTPPGSGGLSGGVLQTGADFSEVTV